MVLFTSKYLVTLDGKGRIVLPAPFKKELGDVQEPSFVIEKDVNDKCLNIYPHANWLVRVEKLRRRLNPDDPIHSKMLSRYYEEIVKINMAENGRLNIPDEMLEYAGIIREALFTGQGTVMKLWEPSRHKNWRIKEDDYEKNFTELFGGPLDNY